MIEHGIWPVTIAAADRWLAGQIGDGQLFLAITDPPGALYWRDLPSRRDYKAGVHTVLRWRRAGAVALIFRTDTPMLLKRFHALGALFTLKEPAGQYRCVLPPAAFDEWLRLIE